LPPFDVASRYVALGDFGLSSFSGFSPPHRKHFFPWCGEKQHNNVRPMRTRCVGPGAELRYQRKSVVENILHPNPHHFRLNMAIVSNPTVTKSNKLLLFWRFVWA
jgi:hypothetical protein